MTMELVEHVELTSSAASIEITGIPTTGKDLVIYACLQSSTTTSTAYCIFNNDTTLANYPQTVLYGDQTGVGSFTQNNYGFLLMNPSNTSATDAMSFNKLYVANYNSTGNKSITVDQSNKGSSTTFSQYCTALSYTGTSGITSVKVQGSSGNLVAGSIVSIYTVS